MPELLDRKARVLAPLVGKRGADGQIAILEVAGEIEWAQARLAGPAAYAEAAARAGRSPKLSLDRVADVYRRYQEEKRKRGVIDFDDLIRLTAQALETDAEFAATQRWRFRHLFVDEFQDVSRAQLRLLRAWLAERDALCVVGDPDQAIYSFAGADPGYLTEFDRPLRRRHDRPARGELPLHPRDRAGRACGAAPARACRRPGRRPSRSRPHRHHVRERRRGGQGRRGEAP